MGQSTSRQARSNPLLFGPAAVSQTLTWNAWYRRQSKCGSRTKRKKIRLKQRTQELQELSWKVTQEAYQSGSSEQRNDDGGKGGEGREEVRRHVCDQFCFMNLQLLRLSWFSRSGATRSAGVTAER